MNNTTLKLAMGLASVLLVSANAFAAPIATTTYGGNRFDLYDAGTPITWVAAEALAVSYGGHLAALTSAGETTAVYNALINNGPFNTSNGFNSQFNQAWLGGYTADLSGSTSNPFNWAWINGAAWTAFDAANFAPGEPNGDSSGLAINRFATAQWNDEGASMRSFIVETPLPDGGSTLGLLGLGLVAVGAVRRKIA